MPKLRMIITLCLFLVVSFASARISDIQDVSEAAKVSPDIGPLYLNEAGGNVSDNSMYNYSISISEIYENLKNKKLTGKDVQLSLWIYNDTKKWVLADSININITKKDTKPYIAVNIAKYVKNALTDLRYKFKFLDKNDKNISLSTKEYSGPFIYVALNESYQRSSDKKGLFDYSVDVYSNKTLLPVGLYVFEKNKWVRYGSPQTYSSPGVWKRIEWNKIKYFKAIEFRPLDQIGKHLIKSGYYKR
jgi:hypothetical protein